MISRKLRKNAEREGEKLGQNGKKTYEAGTSGA